MKNHPPLIPTFLPPEPVVGETVSTPGHRHTQGEVMPPCVAMPSPDAALSEIAFDALDHIPEWVNGKRRRPKQRLAVDLEKARSFSEDSFHAGTLAALDVVYLHDQEVVASEIVNATDAKALLRHAKREEYMNLAKLRQTIRRLDKSDKAGEQR